MAEESATLAESRASLELDCNEPDLVAHDGSLMGFNSVSFPLSYLASAVSISFNLALKS